MVDDREVAIETDADPPTCFGTPGADVSWGGRGICTLWFAGWERDFCLSFDGGGWMLYTSWLGSNSLGSTTPVVEVEESQSACFCTPGAEVSCGGRGNSESVFVFCERDFDLNFDGIAQYASRLGSSSLGSTVDIQFESQSAKWKKNLLADESSMRKTNADAVTIHEWRRISVFQIMRLTDGTVRKNCTLYLNKKKEKVGTRLLEGTRISFSRSQDQRERTERKGERTRVRAIARLTSPKM